MKIKEKALTMLYDKKRVPAWQRLLAYGIDYYLIALMCNLPIMYYKSIKLQTTEIEISLLGLNFIEVIAILAVMCLLLFLYLVLLPKKTNQTLGKKITKIKIVSLDSNELTYKQLLIRASVMMLIEGALYAPSILICDYITSLININLFYLLLVISVVSVIYSLFNTKQAMFHDMIAKTRVIKK